MTGYQLRWAVRGDFFRPHERHLCTVLEGNLLDFLVIGGDDHSVQAFGCQRRSNYISDKRRPVEGFDILERNAGGAASGMNDSYDFRHLVCWHMITICSRERPRSPGSF